MQIQPNHVRQSLKWLEYTYASVLIFVLTQGPVLSLWFASEKANLQPALAPHLTTYFLVQIPALILVSRQKFDRSDVVGPVGAFALFCIWMMATTLWATNGQHSIVESVSLLTTFTSGVYLAKRFSLVEKLGLITMAMQPGLLLSRYAIARQWNQSVNAEGFWVGIYFNRNSLAPVAMVSTITSLALLYVVYKNTASTMRITKIWLLVDAALFSLVMTIRTHSNTPFGGLVAFIAVFVFWEAVKRSPLSPGLAQKNSRARLAAMFAAVVGICSFVAIQAQSRVLQVFGETVDFNGRSAIWKYSWNGFLDRPILGWGWLSAWRSWAFMKMDLWWTVEGVTWSHNAFLDVLLGGGVIAVVLFVAATSWGVYRLIPHGSTGLIHSWPIAFVFFYLAMCTQESFIMGNHFLWLLFIALVASNSVEQDQPLPA